MPEKNKILEDAFIPKELWDACYITNDGLIFRPEVDRDTCEQLKTGKESYQEWLENKDKPSEPQPDKTRILEDEVATLKQEKQVLAQNVYELASVLETLITATVQGGGTDASTTSTDTTTEAKTN